MRIALVETKSRKKDIGAGMRKSTLHQHTWNWMNIIFVLTDFFAILAVGLVIVEARFLLVNSWQFAIFAQVGPLALICLGVYALQKLYPGIGLDPVVELRRLSISTTGAMISFAILRFLILGSENYPWLLLTLVWILSLVFVPLGRAFIRAILSHTGWWGEPVAVIGFGEQGQEIVDLLLHQPKYGLSPHIVFDESDGNLENTDGIPALQVQENTFSQRVAELEKLHTAILVREEISRKIAETIYENPQKNFKRVIVVPKLDGLDNFEIAPFKFGGVVGLELQQKTFNKEMQFIKRLIDISAGLIGGLVILPLVLFIALCIRLDSKGSIFYTHERIGKSGRTFKMWKFRTMVMNAEQVLENYLNKYPELRAEWEAGQKLKDDPRLTRVGKFLRKSSLDELPQLWNVLNGDMSLIGPRPIVEEERKRYEGRYQHYEQVRPGITGMWQVSGRNDTTYEERIQLDEYYVRSWSLWLDVYILIRTVWVVISCKGAY